MSSDTVGIRVYVQENPAFEQYLYLFDPDMLSPVQKQEK